MSGLRSAIDALDTESYSSTTTSGPTLVAPSSQQREVASDDRPPISMIGRVDALLEVLKGQERPMSISDLALCTGIPKATVSRIAAELVDRGLLERQAAGLRLGLRLFELGEHASRPTSLRRLALVRMARLRKVTQQTVNLAVLERDEIVHIAILRSPATPPLPTRVGGRLPAYATGLGKALLSYLPDRRVCELVPDPVVGVGPRTVGDRASLLDQLAMVRTAGVAYEREEFAADVACVAALVPGADGRPIAALSVSAHAHLANLQQLGVEVRAVADLLARDASKHRLVAADERRR